MQVTADDAAKPIICVGGGEILIRVGNRQSLWGGQAEIRKYLYLTKWGFGDYFPHLVSELRRGKLPRQQPLPVKATAKGRESIAQP